MAIQHSPFIPIDDGEVQECVHDRTVDGRSGEPEVELTIK